MTNGDAVRNMTDYELAHFITAIAKLINIYLRSECNWELFTASNLMWLTMETKK